MAVLEVLAMLGLVDKGLDLLKTIKGGEVLKEHLELLRDRLRNQAEQQAKLEQDLQLKTSRVAELEEELATKWKRYGGALFHILPNGKMDAALYCPRCRVSTNPRSSFRCSIRDCGWASGLQPGEGRAALEKAAAALGVELSEPLAEPPVKDSEGPRRTVIHPGLKPRNLPW